MDALWYPVGVGYGDRDRRGPGRRPVREVAPGYGLDEVRKLERVIEVLGNGEVARILGVSASQPSRWRSGAERIGHENLTRLLDLDLVVSRMLLLFGDPRGIASFLDGRNPFLNFARPRDVFRLEGPLAVLPAIEGEEQAAFA